MKKVIALLVLVSMIIGLLPVASLAEALLVKTDANMKFNAMNVYYTITPEMFTDLGGWRFQNGTEQRSYREKILSDVGIGTDPANIKIELPKDGEYSVFVHTRDFATNQSGARWFEILVDGEFIGKGGVHKQEGWAWEKITTKALKKGEHTITLNDSTRMARVDYIFITDDSAFVPGNTEKDLSTLEKKYNYYGEEYANSVLPVSKLTNMSFKDGYAYYTITPEMVKDLGGWTYQAGNVQKSHRSQTLFDQGTGNENANFKFLVPKDGVYNIFVHARDFSTNQPGGRTAEVGVDNKVLGTVGHHLDEGWAWQAVQTVYLTAGEHTLNFINKKKMARIDMAFITNDGEFYPGNAIGELKDLEKNYLYDASKVKVEKVDHTIGRPDTEIAVRFNGNWMNFDVDPILLNDRTMVPMRAIFEALGADVSWDNDTETASGMRNGKKVSVTIGSDAASVGNSTVKIDQSAVLINDRTLVPLRFVSEAFGADVSWDNDNQIVIINAAIPADSYYITDTSYDEYGTWSPESEFALSDGSGALIGTQPPVHSDGTPVSLEDASSESTKPAVCKLKVAKEGQYRIWVRGRDFKTNQQGVRTFRVDVNGTRLDKIFGQHGENGYRWEDGGTVYLKKGVNNIEVHDTSGYFARLAGIYITQDLKTMPSSSHPELVASATVVDQTAEFETSAFPVWATVDAPVIGDVLTIATDKIKVNFYNVDGGDKGQFVQNEILINDNGNWVTAKAKTEKLAVLQMRSDNAKIAGEGEGEHVALVEYEKNGVKRSYTTKEMFRMGDGAWLIPVKAEKQGDKVILYYNDVNGAVVTETWETDSIMTSPKVTLNAKFTKDGYYSFVLSNGDEVFESDFEAVTLPFRIFGQRAPKTATMIVGMYMFTPMSTVTIASDKTGLNKSLTKGIAIDGDEIPEWTYHENNMYMAGLRGASKGLQGIVATPIMGYDTSKFAAGDTYTFIYRPVNELGTWFDAYKSVAENIYSFQDGRSNYYTNLNDAIYNTTDILLDSFMSGFDKKMLAFYNMEARNTATQADPLAIIQRYLLTEDDAILTERAIPTLAYMLSRSGWHVKNSVENSAISIVKDETPSPIGTYSKNMPKSTMTGSYAMSNGMMPIFLGLGMIPETNKQLFGFNYYSINNLELYKTTGDKKYLDLAKQYADEYIATTLDSEVYMTERRIWKTFVNVMYYPETSAFIDLYELTGEQKYLDAAKRAGEMNSACIWIPGYENGKMEGEYVVTDDMVYSRPYSDNSDYFFWHGEKQWRIGGEYGGPLVKSTIRTPLVPEEEVVPAWLPGRTALSIEQAQTYDDVGSGPVYMSHWANDLLRLSEYTDDDFFNTIAKNAFVGRFGSFTGYYITRNSVHQFKPEYPYYGPDHTSYYCHQIPPYLAMLEDFLITDAWERSGKAIEFPSVRQHGYAWFSANHYGFDAGKVYDMNDMWLWNDRGIVELDTVLLNYVPAKKDGLLAVAFMNTAPEDVTTTVSLGEKVKGGASYSGTATLYDAEGNKSTTEVKNGKFTITVPAKGITTIALNIDGVKKPAYASKDSFTASAELGATVAEHTRGRAYTLQLSPDKYFAYVFVTDRNGHIPETEKAEHRALSATLTYTVNGKTETKICPDYPYEFIIPVDDVNAEFTYTIKVEKIDGTTEELGGGTIMTAEQSAKKGIKSSLDPEYVEGKKPVTPVVTDKKPEVSKDLPKFEPFEVKYGHIGTGSGGLRFIIPASYFKSVKGFEDKLAGVEAKILMTDTATNETITVNTYLLASELRTDGGVTITVKPTTEMPAKDYIGTKSHTFEITLIYPN